MRVALERLLHAAGYATNAFGSAESLIEADTLSDAGCVVLDVGLPGISGLQLGARLARETGRPGLIFITARTEPFSENEARRLGAAAFLRKPFSRTALLDAVSRAFKG